MQEWFPLPLLCAESLCSCSFRDGSCRCWLTILIFFFTILISYKYLLVVSTETIVERSTKRWGQIFPSALTAEFPAMCSRCTLHVGNRRRLWISLCHWGKGKKWTFSRRWLGWTEPWMLSLLSKPCEVDVRMCNWSARGTTSTLRIGKRRD